MLQASRRSVSSAFGLLLGALILGSGLVGCAVTQPRGEGELSRVVEPTMQRGYWRYLPKEYVAADPAARQARRWPVVVSFHGMKPFDNAYPQALEWESEADRYGYIVVAPELQSPDMLAEFPVKSIHPSFRRDEEATVAIMRHLCQTTSADCSQVLATSWSSGGYLAHYMFNRHPEIFTCLAVRQSNFSVHVLDPVIAARSRENPVLIVNTENDFAICKEESAEAIQWYERNGYRSLAWLEIKALGHQRTPDMAADFFSRVAGVTPNSRPIVLAERQAINGNARGMAFLSGQTLGPAVADASNRPSAARATSPSPPRPAAPASVASAPRTVNKLPPQQPLYVAGQPPAAASTPPGAYVTTPPSAYVTTSRLPTAASATPAPPAPQPASPAPPRAAGPTYAFAAPPGTGDAASPARPTMPQVGIQVTSAIGTDPHLLGFSAECPADWYRTADFMWTLNGQTIGNAVSGQRTIDTPGEYQLGLLVVTDDGVEHRANRMIRVIPRVDSNSATRALYGSARAP